MRVRSRGHLAPLALLGLGLIACTAGGGAVETTVASAALSGPQVAFPNLAFSPTEVGKPVAVIKSTNAAGAPRGHSNVAVINGHLLVPFAPDSGQPGGGLSFYDLTDPRNPVLVKSVDEPALREAHGFGFSTSYGGNHAVFQTTTGVQFWDLSDVSDPRMVKDMVLPGIQASDYAAGAWWVFWQAPYVYLGGSGNGLYVIDAADLANPQLVTVVPTGRGGGFRIGPVYAFGNVLVASSADLPGYAVFDISDPRQPVLSAALPNGPPVYSILFNGNRIYGAGLDGRMHVHDVSNPARIVPVGASPVGPGRGGYLSLQDGFVHGGFSEGYAKFDLRTPGFPLVLQGTSGIANRDEDFGMVIGNLVFVGDDHGVGTALLAHQAEPDTTPPAVNAVNPADGATRQRLSTRVGLSFTDQIDLGSVTAGSIIVRPVGGAALPGKYSTQTNLANFTPDAPLLPDTTYEVVVPAGGVRDYAGNPIATELRARFATGAFVAGSGLACLVAPTTPVESRASARVGVQLNQPGDVKLTFDFGDGRSRTVRTRPGADGLTTVEHRYREPGHYNVIVTATSGSETTTCARIQTAHAPLTARAPTASSTILHDGASNLVWVVNPDNDSVSALDPVSLTRRREIRVGRNPRTLARAPDGTIWVTNQDDGSISVVDAAAGTVAATIALGTGSMPYGIAFDPEGTVGYATLQATGQLARLDPQTRTLLGTTALEGQVRGIAVDASGRRVLVTRFISPEHGGEVFLVRGGDCGRIETIALANDPGPDGEATGRGVPNYLTSITISPDGRRAFVASKKDNVQRGLARDGLRPTFETMVRTIVSQIDLRHRPSEDLRARRDLNDKDMAQAVAFSRHGDYAVVALQGSNEVQFLDAYTGALVGGIPDVGFAPQGVAFSADHRTLFVNNFLSRNVAVYDVSGLIDSSDTIARPIGIIPTVAGERLPFLTLLGKQVFYNATDRRMNRDGYISCASCHLDGDSDGRVWDFSHDGEGLRNTVALVGKSGMRHGPVHWSGNFDEIQDFEHSPRNLFGGTGFLPDAVFNAGTRNHPLGDPKLGHSLELDGLAAFLSFLSETPPSPYRNPDGTMTAEALAGKQLFGELGCRACHGGPEFTDSALGVLHDVGTLTPRSGQRLGQPLTGLDTPTLKGLWLTAPYLHDGSAPTLHDVLVTRNRAGRHGATAGLSAAQLQSLVRYLLELDDREIPRARISNLVVADAANAARWAVRPALAEGDFPFGDRGSILQGIPGPLLGMRWIRSANASAAFTGETLVSFTIDQPAEVIVAIDERAVPPPWLDASWTANGRLLVRESFVDFRPTALYRKSFPAGPVSLGSLARTGVNNYIVIVR